MYYDLIASLPYLPYFERADRLPITPLRLEQRLRRLRPVHAEQLNQAQSLVRWRAERLTAYSDRSLAAAYAHGIDSPLNRSLREYIDFRMTQQTLLAALRWRRDGLGQLEESNLWGVGACVPQIRRRWDAPYFGLEYAHPWLPLAAERLSADDALGLERLLIDLNWRWLTHCAEQSIFGFEAVVAFVFKWDMLKAWLECDPNRAKVRFTELIDKVTNAQCE